MKIKIPKSGRNKALFVIDVQPNTLNAKAAGTSHIIRATIKATGYPFYALATYYADSQSMLFKQSKWSLSREEAGATDEKIISAVAGKNAPVMHLTKSGRSAFKCEQRPALLESLKALAIEEIHIVGYDINDCVLATAYDAIDLGFYTYVIEEACNHYAGDENLVAAAIKVLRQQNMTNNSSLFEFEEICVASGN